MIKYLSLFKMKDVNYVPYSLCCSFCISFRFNNSRKSEINSFVIMFSELLCLGVSHPAGEHLHFSLLH